MGKKTKLAVLIGALAAVVSAVILVVVFWDRLLELCPCCKNDWDDDFMEDDGPVFTEDELEDFADLDAE
ncbi:MAG: hypothetical protein J6J43_04400 [Oscillospiraceae bacterium]|nr:hypothetical protein [Oscillospiraceae bacterium]